MKNLYAWITTSGRVGGFVVLLFLNAAGQSSTRAGLQAEAALSGEVGKNNHRPDMPAPPGQYIRTVVLDPGHGGHDSGCRGRNVWEKHVALAIARHLGNRIREAFPDVRVVFTRERDLFVPLHERARIANDNQADLFISIHCNAVGANTHLIKGSETYVLGLHRAEENLQVAMRENASILLEENYEAQYDFDPNSPEGYIMLTLFQHAYLEQSIRFAQMVEDKIGSMLPLNSRGVKQAGFLVLRETAMPSVLVETGYLTNSRDERFLRSAEGQRQMAEALFQAFRDFKLEVEGSAPPALAQTATTAQPATPPRAVKPERSARAEEKASAPILPATPVSTAPPFEEDPFDTGIQFRVQLAASPRKLDTGSGSWNHLPQAVEVLHEQGLYKYQMLPFSTFEEAREACQQARRQGFPDAFVVAYRNGRRIPTEQALREIGSR